MSVKCTLYIATDRGLCGHNVLHSLRVHSCALMNHTQTLYMLLCMHGVPSSMKVELY